MAMHANKLLTNSFYKCNMQSKDFSIDGRCRVLEQMVEKAKELCLSAHAGQVDRAGEPYWKHPFAVWEKVRGDEVAEAVALLHDVIEDTDMTEDGLRRLGFPDEVVWRVAALTRRDGEPYLDYVRRAAQDAVTRKVKLADIGHNTDPSRAASSNARLAAKYAAARVVLARTGA